MKPNFITQGILRAIAIVVGVLLLLFFLYKVQAIILYIVIASVISLISRPIIKFFTGKLKLPKTSAVIITIVLLLTVLFGLVSLFIPLIIKQGHNLSLLNIEQLRLNIRGLLSELNIYFSERNISLLEELKSAGLLKNLIVIPNLLNSIIETIGSFSIGLFSVVFISFFFMKDNSILENSIYTITNDKSKSKVKKSLSSIKNLLSRYFIGLILQISILFIIYTITLVIFDVENPIVIAFLCALLNLIPYLGPIIGGILIMFLTMSSNLGMDLKTVIIPTTTYVMIGYLFAQIIDNFLSQPLIFSNRVKSHPLEIFLVIMISGILFGVLGMIIAVPTYTVIKVVSKEFLSNNKIVKSLTKNF